MSELEHCRLAHEGKKEALVEKIDSNVYEDLSRKKDLVRVRFGFYSIKFMP